MYKAKIEIGGYAIGDEVPEELAIVWEGMYKKSPVEKVSKDAKVEKKVSKDKEVYSGSILEDYLARSKSVVLKNLKEDRLSQAQLKELYEIESKNKKRKQVLNLIKKRKN